MDPVVTITETGCRRVEGCGCAVEGVAGTDGMLYWVPVEACPEHCGCLACRQLREYERAYWKHEMHRQHYRMDGVQLASVLDKFDKRG